MTDGRFPKTKGQVVAADWIIQVKSCEEALELGLRIPGRDNQTVEVRRDVST